MTATLHALGAGRQAGAYYTSDPNFEARPHRRDEYYVGSGGESETGVGGGVWWTSGESIVAHNAPVDVGVFRDLCAGLDPRTGDGPESAKGLVRAAGEGHRAGWDLTLSAPKTLSLLWAAGDAERRVVVHDIHRQAVDRTLQFIEREGLLEARLGAGGIKRERPTDLVVGRFDHFTSREGDPNIHCHCVIINAARCRDGKYRTLEPRALYDWQKVAGAAYRMHISEGLHEAGFVTLEAGRHQIEVAGIDQRIIDRFSKRAAAIEAIVGDRDDATGRQKEIANLSSRQGKDKVPTGNELEARWEHELGVERAKIWENALAVGREHNFEPERRQVMRGATDFETPDQEISESFPQKPEVAGSGPAARAASDLLRHDIVIGRKNLLGRAFVNASLIGVGETTVADEIRQLEMDDRLLRLSKDNPNAVWTTPELARIEEEMLKAAQRPNESHWITETAIEAALGNARHLSDEQIEAVRATGSRDGVVLLQAGAGTGKTTTARPIVEAAQQSGLTVLGLAPSWVAADELRASTGISTFAIAKWLYDRSQGEGTALTENTVVLVDEASMVGTRDMAAILIAARDAKAKVALIGDQRQLEAVGAGGPLRIVAEVLERESTLAQVRRQKVAWQRDASIAMARGDVATGVAAYLDHGAVDAVQGRDAALARATEAWIRLRERHGSDVLMIARRNRDVADLNRRARSILKAQGAISAKEISLPSIDRQNKVVPIPLAIGDRLRFGQSHPDLGLRNGSLLTLEAIEARDEATYVVLRGNDGRKIEAAWADLAPVYQGRRRPPRIVHSYASTVYGAQGRTVAASVYAAVRETDARELYVALTRHSNDLRIIVADEPMNPFFTKEVLRELVPDRLMRWSRTLEQKRNVLDLTR